MSRAARAAGIQVGMRRGGALTLSPEVCLVERDPQREAAGVHALAVALMRFSPLVTLAAEATVLVDVGASLRLFGGIRALRRQVAATVSALAVTGRLGLAPTGTGAWLLARRGATALSEPSLRRRIASLPIASLPQARTAAEWLDGIGCLTLGDVLRLPRKGLTRRTDPALLTALDRAVGDYAEGFQWLALPAEFDVRQELPDRTDRADLIVACTEGLVTQLAGWLSAGQYALNALSVLLEHERWPAPIDPTAVTVTFSDPATEPGRILRLVREHIDRTTLPSPVLAVRLRADKVGARAPVSESLFPEPGGTPADHARLIELLVARLGDERLRRPAPVADHSPEVANRWLPFVRVSKPQPSTKHLRRPLWLLDAPVLLNVRDHRPFYGSPLRLISTPECIEAGWWTGQYAARDYFVAEDAAHCCYWIYRERVTVKDDSGPRWFLHGLFG